MTIRPDVADLARPVIETLPVFTPEALDAVIDLSDNTNLWGAPPAVVESLRAVPAMSVSRYPSLYSAPLREAILRHVAHGATPDIGVVTGCGSDDVLDVAMRAYGAPGGSVAFSSPTFTMIPVFARLNGLTPAPVPLTDTFDLDAQRLVDCRAGITYICAPNNPTATPVSRAAVEYVLLRAEGVVLLDEAYVDFAPESFVDLVAQHDRLIVTRTFSKAFGMAGLRMGFGVAHSGVVDVLNRARGPYKANAIAERAVLAALEEGPGGLPWVREHAALVAVTRLRLVEGLRRLGLEPLPSATNFVLVPTPRAVEMSRELKAQGVLVRPFTGLPHTMQCFRESGGCAVRIGVGPWEMMLVLLDALARARTCA